MKRTDQPLMLNLLPILTAIIMITSHVGYPPWGLLFGLTPLWFSWLADPRPLAVFLRGWLAQFGFSVGALYWIFYTAKAFGHLSTLSSFGALLLYGAFGSLYFPLAGLTWALLNRRGIFTPSLSLCIIACLTFLYETIFPAVFPWNFGYHWFSGNLPAFQWADVIGVVGLSFLTYAFNAAFAIGWINRYHVRRFVTIFVSILLCFIALQLSGHWHGKSYQQPSDSRPLHILIVQGNIGNNEKFLSEKYAHWKESVLTTYLSLTDAGLRLYPNTDLIIWPETAFPRALNVSPETDKAVQRLLSYIRQKQIPLLTGSYYDETEHDAMYNAAFLINKNGKISDVYRKIILLIFGEYFPGAAYFPALKKLIPSISNFKSGTQLGLLSFQDTRIGMQICYEGLYPNLIRQMSLQGANWMVNLTNDSWFGGGLEAVQHLFLVLPRAVELRIPLVRVTNTGISTAINADGSYQALSTFGRPWFHQYTIWVSPQSRPTFYARYGYYFPWLIFFGVILIVLLVLRNAK